MNSRSVGIVARGFVDRKNFPGQSEGYIGELWVNRNGSAEPASLNIFAGSDQSVAEVPKFDFKADSGYRLVFSGVGNQLALRLFKLSDLQRPVAVTSRTASRWSGGPVGLWVGNYGKGDYDFTLDNFFVSGTKANRQRPYPEDEE